MGLVFLGRFQVVEGGFLVGQGVGGELEDFFVVGAHVADVGADFLVVVFEQLLDVVGLGHGDRFRFDTVPVKRERDTYLIILLINKSLVMKDVEKSAYIHVNRLQLSYFLYSSRRLTGGLNLLRERELSLGAGELSFSPGLVRTSLPSKAANVVLDGEALGISHRVLVVFQHARVLDTGHVGLQARQILV